MRSLFSQFSGLIGILTFVNLLLAQAPIERALLTAVGSGLSVYVVLSLGDIAIQRILEHASANLPAVQETPNVTEQSPEEALKQTFQKAAAASSGVSSGVSSGAPSTAPSGTPAKAGGADTLAA